jgi:hypothetical protein
MLIKFQWNQNSSPWKGKDIISEGKDNSQCSETGKPCQQHRFAREAALPGWWIKMDDVKLAGHFSATPIFWVRSKSWRGDEMPSKFDSRHRNWRVRWVRSCAHDLFQNRKFSPQMAEVWMILKLWECSPNFGKPLLNSDHLPSQNRWRSEERNRISKWFFIPWQETF